MYEAFKKSPGNQYKNLTNIKNGWKECNQVKCEKGIPVICFDIVIFEYFKTLCAIEAQTEALLGTFQFEIESKVFILYLVLV